jgi:SecD/SecF fusion protein
MRNKGFFWFLTVLLTAVCIYQLSFTWVTSSVENKAEKQAKVDLASLKAEAAKNGGIALLPNDTEIDFSNPEADAIALGAILNDILKRKAETPVYPLFGSTFKDVKKSSLAFGLDLVGGMSVTLEISIPDLVKSFARNEKSLTFKRPFDKAVDRYSSEGGDFISLFEEENKRMNNNLPLARLLVLDEIGDLTINSTDAEVTQFMRDKASSSMAGVEQIMERRINQFGVAQPNIQRDLAKNRLYIELPGVQDEATVAAKMQSTANLQFFETYFKSEIAATWDQAVAISKQKEAKEEDLVVEDTVTNNSQKGDTSKKKLQTLDEMTKSLGDSSKGLSDLVQSVGEYSIGQVTAENKPAVDALLRRNDIISIFPPELKFMWSAELERVSPKSKEMAYTLYAIKMPENGKARVGGTDVKSASTGYDQQNSLFTVDLSMSETGADKWGQMTEENKDRIVAITMDNVVYSAPRVINAITGGNTQISGSFTSDEAKDLAGLLNGGALPAPCVIKDQSTVGPTIGLENSKGGLISFAFAFLAVLIYMYFYYGKAGMAANVALFINVILILGCLASFGAVLTLAGIAGIVLTIGTAVDANILIFERVREEQNRGVDMKESLVRGFNKALPSIIDANVTHLLVAVILVSFGKGEIKSFATTLIIGIFTSMFSAIIISKLLIYNWLEKGKSVSFSTKMSHGLFQNFHFDWIGKRKYFYMFSISATIIGVIAVCTLGLKQSVEFTGGRTFTVKFDNKADINYLRGNLEKVFVENGEVASIDLKTKSNDFNVEIITNYKLKDDAATNAVKQKLRTGLDNCKEKMGRYTILESRSISASVSSELWSSAAKSISLSLLAIFAYILLRFGHWQYSIGAIVGLAHDAFFVISIFALLHGHLPFSLDVNQAFIAAILTVIGYSMNDTVIVFDRIRENLRNSSEKDHHYDIINKSLNTTLSRTFNTSMILFVVILIMFIFGGPAIKGFLFALLVGIVIGTYSSLCVATPILIDFSKRLKS